MKRLASLRQHKFFVANVLLLLASVPFFVHLLFNPIQFNQFLIQRLETGYGVASWSMIADTLHSSYVSGLNILSGRSIRKQPKFDDVIGVFSYVYSWVPPYAVVYPTEGFYYFSTMLDGQFVMGNMRLADADQLSLSTAYFVVPETYEKTRMRVITEKDGLRVNKLGDRLYDVTFNGKTVRFNICKIGDQPPKKLKMIPEEEFEGHVLDESGIKFFLFFNKKTLAFYEVLDEENGVTDELDEFGDQLFLGKRTAFVYYQDKDYLRKVLVGVNLDNIMANNYFDGPADQVPYFLNFRDKLNIAYPNTLLGDGVDEHGVYLNKPQWVRIAVSPYHRYTSLKELSKRKETCMKEAKDKSFFWTCLTKEWWNNPAWRKGIYNRLRKEGKKGSDPWLKIKPPVSQ